MIKAYLIFFTSVLFFIFLANIFGMHAQIYINNGNQIVPLQLTFPTVFFPFDIYKSEGISYILAISCGIGAGLHTIFFKYVVTKKFNWVTTEQADKIFGHKK